MPKSQRKFNLRRSGLKICLVGIMLILSLTLTGCSLHGIAEKLFGDKEKSSSSAQTGSQQKPVLAVALDPDNPNRLLIKKGIQDMAKEAGMEVKEVAPGASGNSQGAAAGGNGQSSAVQGGGQGNSPGNQQSNSQGNQQGSQQSPLQGAKILIVQGSGHQSLIQSAQSEGIPILALDRLPAGVKPAGIIVTDPEERGKLMAELLLTKVREGKVVLLQDNPDDAVTQQVVVGIQQVLKKNQGLEVEVITNPQGAESVARQLLIQKLQQDGRINGILALNERLAAQAYETLKQQGLLGKTVLVGGEANLESLKRVAGGDQLGDIDTSPYLLGVNAFHWAEKIINKESLDVLESITSDQGEVPAKIIPAKQVTAENLAMVQKSYTTTITLAQQEEQQAQQQQQAQNQGGSGGQEKQSAQGNSQSGEQQGQRSESQGASGQSPGMIPEGTVKVNEKIKTEITREYLDAQGKVLGTETTTNHQQRTIPPEMLQAQQQQGQSGQGGDSGKQEKSQGEGESETESGNGGQGSQ